MAEPVETPIGIVTAEHFRPGHVRHQVVVGPKFLYALFNPRDQMHAVSRAFVMVSSPIDDSLSTTTPPMRQLPG